MWSASHDNEQFVQKIRGIGGIWMSVYLMPSVSSRGGGKRQQQRGRQEAAAEEADYLSLPGWDGSLLLHIQQSDCDFSRDAVPFRVPRKFVEDYVSSLVWPVADDVPGMVKLSLATDLQGAPYLKASKQPLCTTSGRPPCAFARLVFPHAAGPLNTTERGHNDGAPESSMVNSKG